MLQEILVSTLTELQFAYLTAALCKHDVLLRITSRGFPWFVKTGKQFTVVFDLTIGCSFKFGRHDADTGLFLSRNQVIIFGSCDLYPVSFDWTLVQLTCTIGPMLKSVSIAGHRIPIKVKDLDDCYGQYVPDSKVIEIDKQTLKDKRVLRETLRHEMIEATLFLSGIAYSETYDQEPIVRALDELFWPAWDRVSKRL